MEAKDLPEFRGLKLGSPIKLTKGNISKTYYYYSKEKEIRDVQELGYDEQFYFSKASNNTPSTVDTKQLDAISLTTFDGNLVEFILGYDSSFQGVSSENVTTKFETALGLPKQSFTIDDEYNFTYVECKDFHIEIKRDARIDSKNRSEKHSVVFTMKYDNQLKAIPKILLARDEERTQKKQNSFVP